MEGLQLLFDGPWWFVLGAAVATHSLVRWAYQFERRIECRADQFDTSLKTWFPNPHTVPCCSAASAADPVSLNLHCNASIQGIFHARAGGIMLQGGLTHNFYYFILKFFKLLFKALECCQKWLTIGSFYSVAMTSLLCGFCVCVCVF